MDNKIQMQEVVDLQVFITRMPGQKSAKYEGMPSYLIANEGSRTSRRSPMSVSADNISQEYTSSIEQAQYIVIANSSAFEEVSFPIDIDELIKIMQALEQGSAKLIDCMKFGLQIFNFVFYGSIRDLFRKLSQDENKILRLTIATPFAELAVLPWELMCDIKPGSAPQFLCFDPQIRLCRALHLFDRTQFKLGKLGEEKVKVLLVTANPILENYLDIGTEERLFRFVIEQSPSLENIDLKVLHHANINTLREALLTFMPHIVHFSGHGQYAREEDLGYIALASVNNNQKPDFVNSYRFSALIQEPKSVQLAFLSTCHGSANDITTSFSGLAQLLHASGVNEVVALSFSVQDKTGHAILANFYRFLLRHGLTVEESVTRVRKFLFINGYPNSESFGLTLYQGNSSYCVDRAESIPNLQFFDGQDFDKTVEDFEAQVENQRTSEKKLADLLKLDKIEPLLEELKPEPREILLLIKVFGELEIGFKVLSEIDKQKINRTVFLEVVEIAKRLALEPNEGKLFPTAFVLDVKTNQKKSIDDGNDKDEQAQNGDRKGEREHTLTRPLHKDFFRQQIKTIVREASSVNGTVQSFFIEFDFEAKDYSSSVIDISKVNSTSVESFFGVVNSKWDKVCCLTRHHGCALVLPGDERVKIVVNGQQIAEYRSGVWRDADFKEFREKVIEVSKLCHINEKILCDVLQKCVFASEIKKGATFLIQRKNRLLDKCHEGYREDVIQDFTKKPIYEIEHEHYIDRIKGLDNAIILDKKGLTIAAQASLAFSRDTKVNAIPGTGSRHLSAQKITKETDAIAFVVSEDRPITIFYEGDIIFRAE